MDRQGGLRSVLCLILAAALMAVLIAATAAGGRTAPENPIGLADSLSPEMLGGNGKQSPLQNTGTEQTGENTRPPEETAPPQTETQPPKENEQSTETRPPEETEPEQTMPDMEPEPTTSGGEPGEPEPGQDDHTGGTESGNNSGGGQNTDNSGSGTAGDNGNGDSAGGENGGTGDDRTPRIRTDLENRIVTRQELPDGMLKFYAIPVGDGKALSVKAVLTNTQTPANGQTLTGDADGTLTAALALNETNLITLFLKEEGQTLSYVRFQIRYETEKADEENPEVGAYPPSIVTSLDGFAGQMETQDYTFWVSARTNPEGTVIYSDRIQVWLNGKRVQKTYGDSRPEYDLHFEPPNVGDDAEYTVKVLAWDDRGNSTMKVYTVHYHTVSEGDSLGEVSLVLDATTVGLGILDTATYPIVQGDTAADVVLRFLEEYGYEAVYDGNGKVGFYLRSISRGDLCNGAAVPETLWNRIVRDGIDQSAPAGHDSLGEYDYTMGSGWMYSINGSIYPGRGLSDYRLSRDTTIYLRFTLAYGKDIGGYDATGQGYGKLSSYCGLWINGGYQPLEHSYGEPLVIEPTETAEGKRIYTCTRCGETKEEILPMIPTVPPESSETTQQPETETEETTAPPPEKEEGD